MMNFRYLQIHLVLLFTISFNHAFSQSQHHRLSLQTHESALVASFPLSLWASAKFYRPDSNYQNHDRGWKNPLDEGVRKIFHNAIFQNRERIAQDISDYLRDALLVYPLLYFPRDNSPTYEFHSQPFSLFDDARFIFSYAEAQGVTFLVTQVAKIIGNRHRPWLAYKNFSSPMYIDAKRETANRSFFSGHTSATFAAASFHHRMLDRFQGKSLSDPEIWGPYLAATITGLLRISADKHHFTDVLTGAVIGTLVAKWIVDLSDYEIIGNSVEPDQQSRARTIPLFVFRMQF